MQLLTLISSTIWNNPELITIMFFALETNLAFIYLYLTQRKPSNLPHPVQIPNASQVASLVIEVSHKVEFFFNQKANESLQMGYEPCSDKQYIEGKWRQFMSISIPTNYNKNLIEGES